MLALLRSMPKRRVQLEIVPQVTCWRWMPLFADEGKPINRVDMHTGACYGARACSVTLYPQRLVWRAAACMALSNTRHVMLSIRPSLFTVLSVKTPV